LVFLSPSIEFLYRRIVQSWFASIPFSGASTLQLNIHTHTRRRIHQIMCWLISTTSTDDRLSTRDPLCPFLQATTIGDGLSLSIMGARRRNLRLARGSADSVCLCAHRYLHHALARPHTRPRTYTIPLHATTLHSHLLPAHTVALHSHLYFGYKLPVWHVPLGLASVAAKDRAALHIHSTHTINTRTHPTPTPLGKVYTRALVVPPSSPHQREFVCGACTGTAQIGVSLVFLFKSTLQTV